MATSTKTYERTHPWISFSLDLRPFGHRFWMALGEGSSKCQHIAGVPLKSRVADRLAQVFLVKGVHATTAIEGNTLSEEEINKRLHDGVQGPPSKEEQWQENANVINQLNLLVSRLSSQGPSSEITPALICEFNTAVLQGLNLEPGIQPGKVRTYSVGVPAQGGPYRGAPAEDCDYLLGRLCQWLNADVLHVLSEAGLGAIETALIRASLAHLYLEWIHPFGDGNGRTGRLIESFILMNAGVPSICAQLMTNHYHGTHQEYYRQLAQASVKRYPNAFVEYAVSGFVEEIRNQLHYIRIQHWDICWRDFVYEQFERRRTNQNDRRRDLVLALSKQQQPVQKSLLPELTPLLAKKYAKVTSVTLMRDVRALIEKGLIVEDPDGRVHANRNLVLAFLPLTVQTISGS